MNTFNLTLDLNKSRAANPVRIRQGDVQGTTITALILDHGATADLTGYTAQFVMDLPDGTHYYRKAASISGNTVTVTIDETQAASVTGRTANAYFQMLQGSTVKASTGSFAVEILPDALADATVPESYDSAIQDAIDNLSKAVEQLPSTVENVLADHPEWTTTVQDGSITKDKLATDLARDRERLLYRLANMLTAQLPEGETATASDAAKTPVAGLALYGRSTQDGTPSPSSPVEIQSVEGRNLLVQPYANSSNTQNGVTFTVNADYSLTIRGTATAATYFNFANHTSSNPYEIEAGTYTLGMGIALPTGVSVTTNRRVGSSNLESFTIGAGSRSITRTFTASGILRCYITVASGATVDTTVYPMLESGSTAYPYVPYGNVGLWARRTSDASTYTVTPIDLDGHELRSLPDGTRDELTVDERGHAVLVQRVQLTTQAVTDGVTGTVGVDVMSSTGAIANGATVLYKLATPVTHDLGTIDPVPLVGPDLTAQAIPTAPMQLTYERDLNTTLARLESAIANLV